RAVSIVGPAAVEIVELEAANDDQDPANADAHRHEPADCWYVSLSRGLLDHTVGDFTEQHDDEEQRSPEQVRGLAAFGRPALLMPHQEEISGEGEAEERALDDHEPDDPPPGQAARPELVGRQVGDAIGEARLKHHEITGSGWRLRSFGQNQAAVAVALGIAPNTTAHGEKIDETNKTPTAMA